MALSIFFSKKAKTVVGTSINLSSHEKHVMDHWNPNGFVHKLSDMAAFLFGVFAKIVPESGRKWIAGRFVGQSAHGKKGAAFDLLRAAVNLMVAAFVISFATSKKLPLSTTYVTFMVAMGTSLADGAWNRDCAPCRIAGVLTVVGGWFITAIFAFLMAGVTVSVLFHLREFGLAILVVAVCTITYKLFHLHGRREKEKARG